MNNPSEKGQGYSDIELKAFEVLDHIDSIIQADAVYSVKNPKTWPVLTPFEKNLMVCIAHLIEANLSYHDRVLVDDKITLVWDKLI